jgi:hypothetical protein
MTVTHKNGVDAQIELAGLFKQTLLVTFALGNIASYLRRADDPPLRVRDRGDRERNVEQ